MVLAYNLKLYDMDAITSKQAFETLNGFINNMGADMDDLATLMSNDHPTLQQKYYSLAAKFIKKMAEKAYVDPRNQFAHDMCVKLYDVLKQNGCGTDSTGAPCI